MTTPKGQPAEALSAERAVRDAFTNGIPGSADAAGWRALRVDVFAVLDALSATRAELAAAVGALRNLAHEEIVTSENEEGEDYVKCDRCDASQWGSDKDDIDHERKCPFAALASLSASAAAYRRSVLVEGIDAAIKFIKGGRFLHDKAPPAMFAVEVCAALSRERGRIVDAKEGRDA